MQKPCSLEYKRPTLRVVLKQKPIVYNLKLRNIPEGFLWPILKMLRIAYVIVMQIENFWQSEFSERNFQKNSCVYAFLIIFPLILICEKNCTWFMLNGHLYKYIIHIYYKLFIGYVYRLYVYICKKKKLTRIKHSRYTIKLPTRLSVIPTFSILEYF